MKKYTRLLIGFAGLSFIILFHEFGHFLVAKIFGLETPIFSIGFGPALFKMAIGQTTFQFALLPLGGYVTFNPEELAAQPYLIKLAVAIAGVTFNVILAYLIFVGFILRGSYQTTHTVDHVIEQSPAAQFGIKPGDVIIKYNDIPLENNPKNFTDFAQTISENPGKQITFKILRNNMPQTITLQLGATHPLLGEHIGWLGIAWKQEKTASSSLVTAFAQGFNMLITTLANIGTLTAELFSEGRKDKIVGPIGILQGIARSLQFSSFYYAMSIALISLNVGIFNLLPLPFLDGGRIVQFTLETIFGPLSISSIIIITLFLFFVLLQILGFIFRPKRT